MTIQIGDLVVATRNGGKDKQGFPRQRPVKGKIYRITGMYEMKYGIGCTLEGMDPAPYRGYFFYVHRSGNEYFERIHAADKWFVNQLAKISQRLKENEDE